MTLFWSTAIMLDKPMAWNTLIHRSYNCEAQCLCSFMSWTPRSYLTIIFKCTESQKHNPLPQLFQLPCYRFHESGPGSSSLIFFPCLFTWISCTRFFTWWMAFLSPNNVKTEDSSKHYRIHWPNLASSSYSTPESRRKGQWSPCAGPPMPWISDNLRGQA